MRKSVRPVVFTGSAAAVHPCAVSESATMSTSLLPGAVLYRRKSNAAPGVSE